MLAALKKAVDLIKYFMNELEKFVTIFVIIYAAYSLYEKCETNPKSGLCGKYNF